MYMKLCAVIPSETDIPKCSIVLGRFNHAILIRGFAYSVRTGIEQRDIAIKNGVHRCNYLDIQRPQVDNAKQESRCFKKRTKNIQSYNVTFEARR